MASKSSQERGTSSWSPVTTGLATPENTALMERPAAGPPPAASITSRSGVPSSSSATPGEMTSPTTVQTIVPGDRLGSHGAEPVASPGEDVGDVGERLDVVHQRWDWRTRGPGGPGLGRLCLPAHLGPGGEQTVLVRREEAGEGIAALDDLEQGFLLTEEILLGAPARSSPDSPGRCRRPASPGRRG